MIVDPESPTFSPSAPLTLHNTFSHHVSFKVKSNRGTLTARPSTGTLSPDASLKVELSMTGEWTEGLKYMVSWV
jgi:hypothetical protein